MKSFLALAAALLLTSLTFAADKKTDTGKKTDTDKKADKKVELKVGDAAPEFELQDDEDKAWSSKDHYGKHTVVVYFYPADMTGGCTKQACGFRDNAKKLKDAGLEVVGISGDSVDNHKIFKKAHKLNFRLLADEQGEVAEKFGVPLKKEDKVFETEFDGKKIALKRAVTPSRWTFIIKDGKVAHINEKVAAAEDAEAVLKLVADLQKQNK